MLLVKVVNLIMGWVRIDFFWLCGLLMRCLCNRVVDILVLDVGCLVVLVFEVVVEGLLGVKVEGNCYVQDWFVIVG